MDILNQYDLQECFDIIANARDYHKVNKKREISEKTRENYQRTARRLLIRDKVLPINIAKSKSTYYVYKAAICSYLMDEISETLPRMDDLRKNNLLEWNEEVHKLKLCIDFLNAIGVDQNKQNLTKATFGEYESDWSKQNKSSKSTPKKSKAKRLRTLPSDWAHRIFQEAVRTNSKHVLAIATLCISGCRPQEVNGVELSLNANGSITVKINGAKRHGSKYGQEYRVFDVKSDSLAHKYLCDELTSNFGHLTIIAKAGPLCDKVSYLSKKIMPFLKEPASAYCFRHKFSGELHQSGLDTTSIAMALGHSADQSLQHYSKSGRSGASGFCISNIHSAQPVKLKNEMRALSKFLPGSLTAPQFL